MIIKKERISEFISLLSQAIEQNTFVKISLANYKGSEKDLKKIIVKKIVIKSVQKLSFTYRYKTRDIVKNHDVKEAIVIISDYLNSGFKTATLFTVNADLILEIRSEVKAKIHEKKPTFTNLPSLNHDRKKTRKIDSGVEKPYLHFLGITDEKGKVNVKSHDKFKQINHYIEILSPILSKLDKNDALKVADMGSGKGYLTFALYDYLINSLKLDAQIDGVEFRKDLVDLCNDISQKSDFSKLKFVESTIEKYKIEKLDVLIALHACDTATDDAIAKGIGADAKVIVVAPCCQHQIRQEIEKSNKKNEFSLITKHGIFLERQSELITDGIRALVLEYFGYKTKVVEFIADAHTHKNIMIIAEKSNQKVDKSDILEQINALKTEFGISFFELEKILK